MDSLYQVIVYYHGGGWVIADLDVYDGSAKGLWEQANAVVVSVHYRQGPEHKFPTAHNDAFAAYQWVVKNAASIKGDAKMIAVAGESAGGNLACNVSIMARDKGITNPYFIGFIATKTCLAGMQVFVAITSKFSYHFRCCTISFASTIPLLLQTSLPFL